MVHWTWKFIKNNPCSVNIFFASSGARTFRSSKFCIQHARCCSEFQTNCVFSIKTWWVIKCFYNHYGLGGLRTTRGAYGYYWFTRFPFLTCFPIHLALLFGFFFDAEPPQSWQQNINHTISKQYLIIPITIYHGHGCFHKYHCEFSWLFANKLKLFLPFDSIAKLGLAYSTWKFLRQWFNINHDIKCIPYFKPYVVSLCNRLLWL